MNRQRERHRWYGMLYRCENPKSNAYRYYGARGIKVCEEWHDFENYYADIMRLIGSCPEGKSLDRIDNDGDYEPGNVRWATVWQQVLNSRVYGSSRRTPGPALGLGPPPPGFGRCPGCKNFFVDLARHIARRHPDGTAPSWGTFVIR